MRNAQSSQSDLLTAIEDFLERHSRTLSPTAFGERVNGDRHLVHKLRRGKTVTLLTADKIRAFIASGKPRPKHSESRAGA